MKIRSNNHGLQIPLNNIIENTRYTATPVNLQIHFLPLFLIILFFSAISISFVLYYLEGRLSPIDYFPTISETCTSPPNSDIFPILSSISAFFIAILFTLYISSADAWGVMGNKCKIIGRIITILCPLSLITLSCCTLEDSFYVHNSAAFIFFGCIFLFFSSTLVQMKKALVKSMFIWRSIFVAFIFISLVGIAISTSIFNDNRAATANAVCEYAFMLFSGLFILTWAKELSLVRLQVVLTTDSESN